MTGALAEAIAEIDDPEIVKKILEAAHAEKAQNPSSGPVDQPSLPSLYKRYLSRRANRSPSTRAQYKRTIPQFINFAENRSVSVPNELSTELLDAYVEALIQEYDNDSTILTYTKNLRAWLRWLSKRDYCDETVYHVLDKDELGLSPTARDHAIPEKEARVIIEKLRQQRRGTNIHALMELIWNIGGRLGDIHSLDVSDVVPSENTIRIRHRPDTGTRLKNGCEGDGSPGDGERDVMIKDRVVEALTSYIEYERTDIVDDHGRLPLFTTARGRASKSTLRRWVYTATSCRWANIAENDSDCDGACNADSDVCPLSYYPHALRRGAIVNHLSQGLRRDRASERFDVSMQVLKRHYDPRRKRKLKEDRAEAVRSAWTEW